MIISNYAEYWISTRTAVWRRRRHHHQKTIIRRKRLAQLAKDVFFVQKVQLDEKLAKKFEFEFLSPNWRKKFIWAVWRFFLKIDFWDPNPTFKLVCFVAFYWTAKKIFKLCSLLEACVWPQLRPLAWLRLTSIKNWRKARKKHSSLTQKREVAFPPWRRCTPSFSFLTF